MEAMWIWMEDLVLPPQTLELYVPLGTKNLMNILAIYSLF
jgi:hypothetical protein